MAHRNEGSHYVRVSSATPPSAAYLDHERYLRLPTDTYSPPFHSIRESTLPPNPFAPAMTSPPQTRTNTTPSPHPTRPAHTMSAAAFVRDHTTLDATLPHQDECPICLDSYTTEQCLRITHIPSCNHHIGAHCLDDMLRSHAHEEKKCPLCRTVWIPAQGVPSTHPRAPSVAVSQRMASMFEGLDGIGADITRNQQQFSTLGDFTPQESNQVLRIPVASRRLHPMTMMTPRTEPQNQHQRNTPIVIDSDSDNDNNNNNEPDYATQVRNFQDFRRDIADIRSRARNTQIGGMSTRRSRKRRAVEKDGGGGGGGGEKKEGTGIASESSNSDNATTATITPMTTGLTRANTTGRQRGVGAGVGAGGVSNTTPGTNALNRFLNNRSRNPFRPAENSSSNSNAAVASSTPPTSLFSNPTDRTNVDVDMTAPEPLPTTNLPTTKRQILPSQRLSTHEADLTRREQALNARQETVARREVAVAERERRVDELIRVVTRQRGQVEDMSRRHGEETDRLFLLWTSETEG